MPQQEGLGTSQRLTMGQKIKNEVATGPEIVGNAAKRAGKVFASDEVIHSVEVGGDQVHRHRQAKQPKVLLKQADTRTATIALGDMQHCWRAIHCKNWNAPTAPQMAGKKPGPASHVGG
jgi:hypothetical protein